MSFDLSLIVESVPNDACGYRYYAKTFGRLWPARFDVSHLPASYANKWQVVSEHTCTNLHLHLSRNANLGSDIHHLLWACHSLMPSGKAFFGQFSVSQRGAPSSL